jgi:hypothetical protein
MKIGQRVTGKYIGKFDFTGTIIESRPLTVPTDGAISHTIQLDQPIEVYGTTREQITVTTLWTGEPSSYTRYNDSMSAL